MPGLLPDRQQTISDWVACRGQPALMSAAWAAVRVAPYVRPDHGFLQEGSDACHRGPSAERPLPEVSRLLTQNKT